MSDVSKQIDKVKSFDKRIEVLLANLGGLDEADAEKSLNLVIEKAKYPQHYAEIVACAASLPIADKKDRILRLAQKANQHPTQTGSAVWVLCKLGFSGEALELWNEMSEQYNAIHSNMGAQMLGYGYFIEGNVAETDRKIEDHKSRNPDVPSDLYDKPKIENTLYLFHLLN